MKNKFFILLSLLIISYSCSDEKVVKFIPLTTDSEEAKEAFKEGIYREDQNETNESRAAFKKAIELDENFLLAKIFYDSTVYTENRERLLQAYQRKSEVSELEQKIIEANYERVVYGNGKKAMAIFDSLIIKYPDIPFLYERTGNMKAFSNEFDKSIEYWKKALEINPKSYYSALRLGLLHVNVGTEFAPLPLERRNLDEGKKWLNEASKIRPNASATPRFLGNFYRAELDLDKALEVYELAVKKNTEKTSQLMEQNLMVGHTLMAMGKYDDARDAYKKTIDVSINNFWWGQNHIYSSYTYLAEKKYDQAILFLSKAQESLKKMDDSAEIIDFIVNRIEFNKWLVISHSQRKEEAMISMKKMNDKRYSDLQTGLKNAIDEKEKERLKRGFEVGTLFRSVWSDIVFGEYENARLNLSEMKQIQEPRLADNPDSLNGYLELSGYLNLMEGNIEESLDMYNKRKLRGDMGEYHDYFYALTLKASGDIEKSEEILLRIANSAFSDWTIAITKNLAKAQLQTNI